MNQFSADYVPLPEQDYSPYLDDICIPEGSVELCDADIHFLQTSAGVYVAIFLFMISSFAFLLLCLYAHRKADRIISEALEKRGM